MATLDKANTIPVQSDKPVQVEWAGVGLFLLLTFGISWLLFIGLRALGVSFTLRASAGMFGPALAALITRLVRHEGFADAGLRLTARNRRGAGRMYIAAYLIPPILIAASIVFVLLTTYQHWDLSQNLQAMANLLKKQSSTLPTNITTAQLVTISLISQTVAAFTFGIAINMIFTLGEEFGWRGYLLPRLAPLGGIQSAVLVGMIWGLWHAPLIVLDGYNYPGYPWLGIPLMMLFCTALSLIFAWLRFRSGSIWPSTLAHAAINAQAGFALILLSAGNALLRAPLGLLGQVPMYAIALFLAATGRLKPDNAPQSTLPVSPQAAE